MIGDRRTSRAAIEQRFDLVRPLGEGGFGIVYEALDRERGMRVALKSLKRLEPRARERFKAEFRELTDLAHPNLPLYYELFTRDGEWFFSMELIEGVLLDAWVRTNDAGEDRQPSSGTHSLATEDEAERSESGAHPLALPPAIAGTCPGYSESRLRSSLGQLRDVLSFLHRRNAVHRDIKPSNIRVRADGHLFLLDFGLVGRVGDLEKGFVGTPAYAAPEQMLGGATTPAADAYALGTIVFELVTGRTPFRGDRAQLLLDKQTRTAPRLQTVASDAPSDIALMVDGWLSKTPEERPAVASATATAHLAPAVSRESLSSRARELGVIVDAFAAVRAGDTRVVVVEGESGVGKTHLVEEALATLQQADPTVEIRRGRPSPKERVPFNAFDGCFTEGARAAVASTVMDRAVVHRVLRESFEDRAPRAPLVIFIDDLQWADDDSVELLVSMLGPPQLRSTLFLLARRSSQSAALVFPCARTTLALGPLSGEEATELARRAFSDLEDTIERVRSLSSASWALLRVLSVSIAPLGEECLARTIGRPRGEVAQALERLRRARLVRVDPRHGVGHRTYDDRVRAAVAATMTPEERVAIHAALLAALDDDADPHVRLEHLRGAGLGEEATRVALEASRLASSAGAHVHAATLLDEVLAAGGLSSTEALDVRKRRLDLLERAHRARDAAEEALRVAAQTESADEAEAYRMRAARYFLATGEITRGRAVLAGLLARAGTSMPKDDLGALAHLVGSRARAILALRRARHPRAARTATPLERHAYTRIRAAADGLVMTDHARAFLFHSRALRLALSSGDPELEADALVVEAMHVGTMGPEGRRKAERLIERALASFPRERVPMRIVAIANVARAMFAKIERPSLDAAEKLKAAEEGILACGVDAWVAGGVSLIRGHCLRMMGDLPRLREHSSMLALDAEARRDFLLLTTAQLGAVIVWLADDAPLAARQLLSQVRWPDEPRTSLVQHWLSAEADVEISLYEGRGAYALERLGAARHLLRFSLLKRIQAVRICCNTTLGRAIVAAIEGGRGGLWEELELRVLIASLRREKTGYADTRAMLLGAGLHAARGDRARAASALAQVEELASAAELALDGPVSAYLRGHLEPGDEGRRLRERGDEALSALGVRVPRRFVRVVAPGFERYLPPEQPLAPDERCVDPGPRAVTPSR